MEFNQESRSFCTAAAALDTVAEQLADVDLSLPDYCPDIEKILKCTLTPQIQTYALSGGQLAVEGVCVVNVMYAEGTQKSVRCCEQSVAFSQNFSVKDAPDNPIIIVKTKPEYINCRALSPRRLVIHGAFSLYAKVLCKAQTAIYSAPPSLEADTVSLPCASLKCFCQELFSVCEDIAAGDRPRIESVLTTGVSAGVTDVKSSGGKLMLSGELNLRMLYLSSLDAGEPEKLDCVVPFNKIMDCDGIEDNDISCVACDIMSYDVRLKSDALSENPLVVLDVKLCATAGAYHPCTEEIVRDAYSTEFSSQPSFEPLKIIGEVRPLDEQHMQKLTVKVDDEKISKILDIYADRISENASADESGVVINGKVNVCVLALNGENMPIFIERTAEFEHPVPQSEGCTARLNSARAASISYRLARDNALEVRCELKFSGALERTQKINAVSDVAVFEDKPLPAEKCALTLYYADKGERLWDIAKAYNTRLELLENENQTEGQSVDESRLLLIPRI